MIAAFFMMLFGLSFATGAMDVSSPMKNNGGNSDEGDDGGNQDDDIFVEPDPPKPEPPLIEDPPLPGNIAATITTADGETSQLDLTLGYGFSETSGPYLNSFTFDDPEAEFNIDRPLGPDERFHLVWRAGDTVAEGLSQTPVVLDLYYSPNSEPPGLFDAETAEGWQDFERFGLEQPYYDPDDALFVARIEIGTQSTVWNGSYPFSALNGGQTLQNDHFGEDPNLTLNLDPTWNIDDNIGSEVFLSLNKSWPDIEDDLHQPEVFRVDISNAGMDHDPDGLTAFGYDEKYILLRDTDQALSLTAVDTEGVPAPQLHLVDLNSFADAGFADDLGIAHEIPAPEPDTEGSTIPQFIEAETADLVFISYDGSGDPVELVDGTWVLAEGAELLSLIKGTTPTGDFRIAPLDVTFQTPNPGQTLTLHDFASLTA